ncbi:bacteriophage protein [Ralstonia sp. NT80]|uniref:DUF2213 domain-containing protein n=2 Tax=Ralstonia sp. NT80 TaxID=1218247 RepID=UPI00073F9E57|nr:DUF2213 domain-containing protein [Ralstonia sp. NT80]GAQ30223.1 bacteriophage protein [Ralstonia sp. NT80]
MTKRIFTADHIVGCTCSPAQRAAALTRGGCNGANCACRRRATKTADAVSATGFFTAEQLGPKQSFTPEGFLLCEEVPIARIGTQDYAGIELPDLEDKDGVIVVERTADVVFSPETIASFMGKPVTIDHPMDGVTPDNWSVLAKGTTHNVRRGEGALSDFLLADLLITDKGAINEVRTGQLIEVSCGYDSDYEQIAPGRARQVTVVGNHVALVKNARCGPSCSIGDSNSNLTGESDMATKKKVAPSSLLDKLRKAFMTNDKEAFEAATSEMTDEDGMVSNVPDIHIHMPGAEKIGGDTTTDEADPPAEGALAQVMEAIKGVATEVKAIGERVTKLEAGKTADGDPPADPDPTNDDEPEDDPDPSAMTGDSAALRIEFQDAMARAEILAPGVQLPTFDSKAAPKKTTDSICVLRRRALRAALQNEHADLVKAVSGGADVSKMTCDSAKAVFNASSELVKAKNKAAKTTTTDTGPKKDINQIHNEFWAKYKV